MSVWERIARQARKEYSAAARLAAIACASLVFGFGIPAFLFWVARNGSERWRFRALPILSILSLVMSMFGLLLAIWTCWVQFRHARGTPIPIMATKKLLTEKPFSFCRNPMALGAILLYSGIALYTASYKAVLASIVFSVFLLAYIKLVEEKELSLRFGDEYSRYREVTPFIVPRLFALKRKSES